MAGGFGFRRAGGPSGSFFPPDSGSPSSIPPSSWRRALFDPPERGYRSQVMAAGPGTEPKARATQIVDVGDAPLRGARVPRRPRRGHRRRGGGRQGHGLPALRQQGRAVPRRVPRGRGQLPAWLDAPADVVDAGFWAVLDYWLRRTEEFLTEQWVANRVAMIGRYDTGLGLRRPIDRLMRSEDPYGTLEFVEFGVAPRRDPRRRGRRDDRVDARLGGRAVPGRARQRGAGSGPGPPQALPPRAARGADPASSWSSCARGSRRPGRSMSDELTWADYYDENEDREPRELLLEALSRFGSGPTTPWILGAAPASTPGPHPRQPATR